MLNQQKPQTFYTLEIYPLYGTLTDLTYLFFKVGFSELQWVEESFSGG